MSEFTKQQLRDALQKLPENIQDIILSIEQSDVFHEIMKDHHLTVEEMGNVVDALAPISFGLVHPKELPARIRKALPSLEAAKVDALIADLNEKMLAPIRAHIIESANKNQSYIPETPDTPPSATTTPPPPAPPAGGLPTGATIDPVQQKLEGSFRLAPDTVVIKKPALTRPIEKGTYPQGADPYREPIS